MSVQDSKLLYIEPKQLEQLEYLLAQSAQGIHLLFKNTEVAKVLSTPTENLDFFTFENITKVQSIFSKFVQKNTLMEKQIFVEGLDTTNHDLLLRAYFQILENAILSNKPLKH
ncbi:MAG: hypothetical protein SGJ18_12835 [Pseudomonadota bacterium]|nr:hypothetical protein [Pseudomonadota bacterium]